MLELRWASITLQYKTFGVGKLSDSFLAHDYKLVIVTTRYENRLSGSAAAMLAWLDG